jgi:subtilisin family serine protease
MSEEREYIVIVNKGENLQEIEEEIKALTGDDFIPNRAVEVADERIASNRMTHFYLTDEEAEILRNDPRILDVEIPIEHRDNIKIELNAYQNDIFHRDGGYPTDGDFSSYANWGLRRHIEEINIWDNPVYPPSGPYEYAVDGTGVDVVIMDSGVHSGHPEFLDENGVSRVKQIDWYQEAGISGTLGPMFYVDEDGHGTHCAGIAAGKTHGWAKGAHIYSIKIFDTDKLTTTQAMDLVKLWHQNKTNGRPTVVNMSFGQYAYGIGSVNKDYGDTISGTYRGQDWRLATDLNGDNSRLETEKGFLFESLGFIYAVPSRSVYYDIALEEMIDAGIHVCIAAGNMPFKIDVPDGLDYNNKLVDENYNYTYYYHRGSSPHSDKAINVGSIDNQLLYPRSDYPDINERISYYSARGSGVGIWAGGNQIMSSLSPDSDDSGFEHPEDSNFQIGFKSGTSMACPQVVGVIAQYLQVNPNITPEQMKVRLINDSKPTIYDTGDSESYKEIYSLVGGENRMLYTRYGKQPYFVKGSLTYRK